MSCGIVYSRERVEGRRMLAFIHTLCAFLFTFCFRFSAPANMFTGGCFDVLFPFFVFNIFSLSVATLNWKCQEMVGGRGLFMVVCTFFLNPLHPRLHTEITWCDKGQMYTFQQFKSVCHMLPPITFVGNHANKDRKD